MWFPVAVFAPSKLLPVALVPEGDSTTSGTSTTVFPYKLREKASRFSARRMLAIHRAFGVPTDIIRRLATTYIKQRSRRLQSISRGSEVRRRRELCWTIWSALGVLNGLAWGDFTARFVPTSSVCPPVTVLIPVRIRYDGKRAFELRQYCFQVPALRRHQPSRSV